MGTNYNISLVIMFGEDNTTEYWEPDTSWMDEWWSTVVIIFIVAFCLIILVSVAWCCGAFVVIKKCLDKDKKTDQTSNQQITVVVAEKEAQFQNKEERVYKVADDRSSSSSDHKL